jgi:hypothetical protein
MIGHPYGNYTLMRGDTCYRGEGRIGGIPPAWCVWCVGCTSAILYTVVRVVSGLVLCGQYLQHNVVQVVVVWAVL